MTEPPRDDSSPTGSAPWERPRRWNQQRMDVTRVDDLLARLGNEDNSRGRRGRRRDAERAARKAAVAPTGDPVPSEDADSTAPAAPSDSTVPAAPGDGSAANPAGELIVALRGPTADQDDAAAAAARGDSDTAADPSEPTAEGSGADSGAQRTADVADAGSPAVEDAPDPGGDAPAAAPAVAAVPSGDRIPGTHGALGGPGQVTAPGMDDHVTDQLPKVVDEDVASIRASLRMQTGETVNADHLDSVGAAGSKDSAGSTDSADSTDSASGATGRAADGVSGSTTGAVGAVPSAAASGAEGIGPAGPTDPPTGSGGDGGRGQDDPGDHHRRRAGFMAAGRAAIAAAAVALLLLTGYEWNTLQTTEAGLKERSGDYLATADPAISTAVASTPRTSTGTGTDAAVAATTSPPTPLPLYPVENILLLGSDSRANGNGNDGNSDSSTQGSSNSDTMMIAHLSADRQHIAIVSFPRYLWIKAPSCQTWDYTSRQKSGKVYPVSDSTRWKISNAYAVGGPACSVLAVQGVTGLRIDRVIDIDFKGFKTMVDALQGVEVNVCRPIIDKELQTVVAQGGVQRIMGDGALSLVRARQVEGDSTGTDGRMRRQQVVLSAMLRQVTSAGTLLNPTRLNRFLKAFVASTHSANMTLDSLLQLAKQLGNLDPGRVTFYSVPHTQAPQERELLAPGAEELFAALRDDSLLPGETPAPVTSASSAGKSSAAGKTSASRKPTTRSTSPSTSSTPAPAPVPQTLTVDPAAVDLQVVNLTGRRGVATSTKNSLNAFGFAITDNDLLLPTDQSVDGITVEYSADNRAAAVTVASAVPGAVLTEVPDLGQRVRLMLGTTYDGTVTGVSVGQDVPSQYRTTPPDTSTSASDASTPSSSPGTSTSDTSAPSTPTQSTSTLSTKELGAINAQDATCA